MKRKNQVFSSFVVALIFCFSAFLIATPPPKNHVLATNWFDYANNESFTTTGDGTQKNPYKISTAAQLATIAKKIDTYKNSNFELVNSIDLSQHNWSPIGEINKAFEGDFNGNNHVISGIKVPRSDNRAYSGLFAYVANNTIKNILIDGRTSIISNSTQIANAGAIAGASWRSTIENCKIINCYIGATAQRSESYVGGIVGQTDYNSRIINCTTYASKIVSYSSGSNAFAGGIVGRAASSTTIIEQCGNNSDIKAYTNTAGASTYAGGIVGSVVQNNTASIRKCYNKNSVTSGSYYQTTIAIGDSTHAVTVNTYSYAGGISGMSGHVSDCFNRGSVYAYALAQKGEQPYSPPKQVSKEVIFVTRVSNIDYCLFIYTYDYTLNLPKKSNLPNYSKPQTVKSSYSNSLAYAGGIMGFGSAKDSITNTYNLGSINGGTKEVMQVDALTLVRGDDTHNLETGHPTPFEWHEWLLSYYITTIYIDSVYYSNICGNHIDSTNSYGINKFYDATITLGVTSYYEGYLQRSLMMDTMYSTTPSQSFTIIPMVKEMKYASGHTEVKDIKFQIRQTTNLKLTMSLQVEYFNSSSYEWKWKSLSHTVFDKNLYRPNLYSDSSKQEIINNLQNLDNWEIVPHINSGYPIPKGMYW